MDEQQAEAPPKVKRVRAPRPKAPPADALIPPAQDPLDAFVALANTQPAHALAALFWHNRHQNPEFSIEVTKADLDAFAECVDYLKVKAKIQVLRPQGLPAQAPIAAQGNRRAVPGRAAQPPKNYVVIQMVDQDGDCFRAIENNEADLARQQAAATAKRTKERAVVIAAALQADAQSGNYSTNTMLEAVEALKALAAA